MAGIVLWIRSRLPTRESIEGNRWLAPFAHRLLHPSLWRFTRRSVPRAVALGLFVAPLIPIAHTLVAALLALPTRANIVVAVAITAVINPFTIPPFYYAAFRIGNALLHVEGVQGGTVAMAHSSYAVARWAHWLMQVSGPAALGTFIMATVMAASGYLLAGLFWKLRIARRWRQRRNRV